MNNRRAEPYERIVYPLLDEDPPLRRSDCEQIIRDAGLPVPPKSACWFCPLKRPDAFARMRRDQPDLFARACGLEDLLNQRRRSLGRDPVWLTRFNRPLAAAVGQAQDTIPGLADDARTDRFADGATCDNGSCFT